MDFARQQRDPTRHLLGIAAVVLVHGLVVYALLTGLGTKMLAVIKKPLTATIVEEIKLPPPPPPPPPKRIEKPPPPPEYVPPPDVPVATVTTSPNVITAVVTAPPVAPPPVIAPPPPPPPPKPAFVRNPNILNAADCMPSMPGEAQRRGVEGSVLAHLYVDEQGNVSEIKIVQSTDKMFERAVMNAMKTCKFQARGDRWVGEVPVEFKLQ